MYAGSENWNAEANVRDMDLWLGPNTVTFKKGTVILEKDGIYGLATQWEAETGKTNWKPTASNKNRPQRFCGWNSLRPSTADFKDIVEGKGDGIALVLHGPSGSGKTLRAEAVSERLRVPLYSMSLPSRGALFSSWMRQTLYLRNVIVGTRNETLWYQPFCLHLSSIRV